MPRTIPRKEVDEWLEWWDQGMGEVEIVKRAHELQRRDPRAVKRHLKEALDNREMRAIRREMARDAFRDHWDHLLGPLNDPLLRGIGMSLQDVPSPHPAYWNGRTPLHLMGCSVHLSSGLEPTKTVHPLEETRQWMMLMQHIGKDPLVDRFREWKAAVGGLAARHVALASAARREISSALPAGTQAEDAVGNGGVSMVYETAVEEASGKRESLSGLAMRLEQDGQDTRIAGALVIHGSEGLDAEQTIRRLRDVLSSGSGRGEWQATKDLRTAIERCRHSGDALASALEMLLTTRFLPGTCDACSRIRVTG